YEEDDRFKTRAFAQQWHGDEDAVDLTSFDCVVGFGKNKTLSQIRAACSSESRFIGFGNRASAGYITAQVLSNDSAMQRIADGAARDLLLYDSQGCLSLHVLFVEGSSERDTRTFLSRLANAAERATIEFPPGARDPASEARRSTIRNTAAFRAATGRGAVLCDDACSFVLVYDQPADEPPAFAPRVLGIIPVSAPSDAVVYLRRHAVAIEAFALSDQRADLVEAAISAGAVRLAPFGELQRLPVSGDHGGRPRIADFIRWIDKEI
ncbi:MAG: hypothetical protein M3N19_02290, partial [Candidatus Eremiobacteraeota bacterium]|nr:hypothetical protein [Candidatus Eremiobacteraeota bacterium]